MGTQRSRVPDLTCCAASRVKPLNQHVMLERKLGRIAAQLLEVEQLPLQRGQVLHVRERKQIPIRLCLDQGQQELTVPG